MTCHHHPASVATWKLNYLAGPVARTSTFVIATCYWNWANTNYRTQLNWTELNRSNAVRTQRGSRMTGTRRTSRDSPRGGVGPSFRDSTSVYSGETARTVESRPVYSHALHEVYVATTDRQTQTMHAAPSCCCCCCERRHVTSIRRYSVYYYYTTFMSVVFRSMYMGWGGNVYQPRWPTCGITYWLFIPYLRPVLPVLGAYRTVHSFHSLLSVASWQTSSHVMFMHSTSLQTVSLQVMRGLPCFFFSSGIHSKACFALLESSIRCTCPNQRSRLFLTVTSSMSCPVLSLIVSFRTLSFHVTFSSFLRQGWWKASKRFQFASVMDHVSAQYSRMASTMDWYNRILTGSPRLFCRHMQSSLLKAELALPIRCVYAWWRCRVGSYQFLRLSVVLRRLCNPDWNHCIADCGLTVTIDSLNRHSTTPFPAAYLRPRTIRYYTVPYDRRFALKNDRQAASLI